MMLYVVVKHDAHGAFRSQAVRIFTGFMVARKYAEDQEARCAKKAKDEFFDWFTVDSVGVGDDLLVSTSVY